MGSMMTPAEERLVLSVLLLWVEEYFTSKTRTIIVSSIYIIYMHLKHLYSYQCLLKEVNFSKQHIFFWGQHLSSFWTLSRESTAATVLPNSVIVIYKNHHLKSD